MVKPGGRLLEPYDAHIIDLSRNELPWPANIPLLRRALSSAAANAHRYPTALFESVERSIDGQFARVGRRALLTRGVDDAVDAILHSKCSLRPLVFLPTFEGFLQRFRALSVSYDSFSLGYDYKLSEAVTAQLKETHIAFLANPNNPTGTIWQAGTVKNIAERVGCLFLDETYIDFAQVQSFEAAASDKVFVFRSFSKASGLAGARLGVLAGPPAEIEQLRARRIFCPIDIFSLHALTALLEAEFANNKTVARILREKKRVGDALLAMGFEVPITETNFLIVRVGDTERALSILLDHAIIVRDLDRDGMPGWIRITIGNNRQMERCIAALKAFRSGLQDLCNRQAERASENSGPLITSSNS